MRDLYNNALQKIKYNDEIDKNSNIINSLIDNVT